MAAAAGPAHADPLSGHADSTNADDKANNLHSGPTASASLHAQLPLSQSGQPVSFEAQVPKSVQHSLSGEQKKGTYSVGPRRVEEAELSEEDNTPPSPTPDHHPSLKLKDLRSKRVFVGSGAYKRVRLPWANNLRVSKAQASKGRTHSLIIGFIPWFQAYACVVFLGGDGVMAQPKHALEKILGALKCGSIGSFVVRHLNSELE